ncbi:MAG TPA: small, acid-soluble spore protein, alpha/beta type [Candidatus Fimousia stercorigallinarum]|nr:small, acid-soluble spore protein, alpha/beta type [Candidatus Fimousia stercorigallinarum]
MKGEMHMRKTPKPLTEDEILKYEIAEELGLADKVQKEGWKSLSAKDTGRIGGLMTKRKREKKK